MAFGFGLGALAGESGVGMRIIVLVMAIVTMLLLYMLTIATGHASILSDYFWWIFGFNALALLVLLGIVARNGNVAWGILLLLLYAVGHGVLVVAAGSSVGFVQKVIASGKYGAVSAALKYGMGGAILLIAFYMFYLGF